MQLKKKSLVTVSVEVQITDIKIKYFHDEEQLMIFIMSKPDQLKIL